MTSLDFWIQPMWLAWVDLVLAVLTAGLFWSYREWSRHIHEVPLLALGVPVPRSGSSPNPFASFAPVFAATASAIAYTSTYIGHRNWR